MRVNYQTTHPGFVYDMTYAFSPTLLNELTLGTSGFEENQLYDQSELAKATKSSSGYNIGQLFPQNNPLNLLPAVSFGGVTNAAAFGYDSRFPMYDRTRQYSISDSITKVIGLHNLKFGADLKTANYLQAHSSSGLRRDRSRSERIQRTQTTAITPTPTHCRDCSTPTPSLRRGPTTIHAFMCWKNMVRISGG